MVPYDNSQRFFFFRQSPRFTSTGTTTGPRPSRCFPTSSSSTTTTVWGFSFPRPSACSLKSDEKRKRDIKTVCREKLRGQIKKIRKVQTPGFLRPRLGNVILSRGGKYRFRDLFKRTHRSFHEELGNSRHCIYFFFL